MDLSLKNGIDPRLEALSVSQDKMVFEIPQGSAYTNKVAQKANSVSNQSVSFNFNTQGKNVLIDRRFYCRMRFEVTGTFTHQATGDNELSFSALNYCPRAFPIASCAENISLSLNGTTVSANYADMMSAYLRYASPEELYAYDLSQTPTQLDFYADYTQPTATDNNSPFVSVLNSDRKQLSRASFNLISVDTTNVTAGAPVERKLVFEVVEPLMLSPLLYSSRNLESALLGVTNIAVNINFGDLSRVICQTTTLSATSASGTFTTKILGVPELMIEYKNLQLVEESKIPQIVRYNYQRPEVFVNDTGFTLAQATNANFPTLTINNNAIQLSTCPKRIYIYASKARGQKTVQDSDTFLPITSLSLSYLNVSGQFSAFTQNDLFNLAMKNGYTGSFQEWSGLASAPYGTDAGTATLPSGLQGRIGLSGSVLCIDSTDLALPSNIASGILVNSQLQFSVGVQNNRANPFLVTITTVIVNDGIMEISEGGMTTRIGVISSEDVLSVRSGGDSKSLVHHTQLEGGGVFDFMRKAVGAIPSIIDKAGDIIETGKQVHDVGKKVHGTVKGLLGRGVHGGAVMGGAEMGGALVGGRNMSKAELRRLLG